MATKYVRNLARALLRQPYDALDEKRQGVIDSLATGTPVAENVNTVFAEQTTFWGALADKLALVVGSWAFILIFFTFLVSWMVLNTFILLGGAFDPYPYILLNLALSTLASVQAPIIMMSQNRQTEKDRITQANAFEVNLKTELAIQQLHEKVDSLLSAPLSDATQ
ncbi:MAG: DUF1003 domain-containing protein [Pseudomonadota bacterium]